MRRCMGHVAMARMVQSDEASHGPEHRAEKGGQPPRLGRARDGDRKGEGTRQQKAMCAHASGLRRLVPYQRPAGRRVPTLKLKLPRGPARLTG